MLGLEEGLHRFLKYPNKEITVYIPVMLDNGHLKCSSLSRSSQHREGAGQGRHSICSRM